MGNKKKIIALTCCRANSRVIKNKNIKVFKGKPLLFWTIQNILNSNIFDKAYLSTDSKKIADIGKKYGLETPHLRPKKLATSTSDVFDTHKYFFNKMNINDNNSIVCIVNNNPFISTKILKKSFKLFKKFNYRHIVMGTINVGSDQIYFRQMKKKNNAMYPIFKKDLIKSTINRKKHKIYYNIGDIRWGKPSWLINYKKFNKILSNVGFKHIEIDENKYQDLNNIEDWKKALQIKV